MAERPIRSREREQLWNQITKQDDNGEDDRGYDPLRNASRERAFPEQEETEDDQRNVHERVGEQENAQNASRIIAKNLDELFERRVFFLEPPKLMRLEGEERGLESGKKRGPKDQNRDRKEEKRKAGSVIFRCGRGRATVRPPEN